MADAEEHQRQQQPDHETKNPEKTNVSFSIWPPSQRTRDAVIDRLVETLSAPSVLSKRYGSIPRDEASATARLIEEEAFSATAAAAHGASADDEGGGIEILQAYSREISKRMLEAVKSKATSGSDTPSPAAPVTSEAFSSAETESS